MVHPLTSVIIPKSIHQSMKKGRLLGGVVPYSYPPPEESTGYGCAQMTDVMQSI